MKPFVYILSLLLLVSCQHSINRGEPQFVSIEITHDNGWTGGQTAYIDSHGIIMKCKYHIISQIDSAICCSDTLDSHIIDSINSYINILKYEVIDSIYDGHCHDCGGYIININLDSMTIKSVIVGTNEFDNTISKFANFISNITIDYNVMDTVIVFKTTKYIIPPPPPDSIEMKDLPPIN